MSDDLLSVVGDVTARAVARLPEGGARGELSELQHRLAEPVRVAFAGATSVGKSTLVNALLAQRAVQTGEGECTRSVTWLRHGDELPNDALRSLTVIDTPGLGSLTEGVSERTRRLLAGDGGAGADAVVYVVAGDIGGDHRLICEFARNVELAGATAANALLAVTKVDELEGDDEPAATLARWQAQLGGSVCAVLGVIGRLGEAAYAGGVDEHRAALVAQLGRVERGVRECWLRSPRRFVAEATVPATPEERLALVAGLGTFGLRRGAELGDVGAVALARRLGELSGVGELRALIASRFVARAGLLKGDAALRTLRRLTAAPDVPAEEAAVVREALVEHADRLATVPEAQRLRELELLRMLTLGRLALDTAQGEEVRRLASGVTPRERLGLPATAAPEACVSAAAQAAARWRRYEFDGRRLPEQREAARVVGLSLAGAVRAFLREAEAVAA